MNKTCICCPLGCILTVEYDGKDITISGNNCKRGIEYAINEVTNPVRVLTTTVYIPERDTMLAVRSKYPVPKAKLTELVNAVKKSNVNLPVKMGQTVCTINDIDIIASHDLM